ncbi:hypothetical protein [Janibacter anophelis]|uniref:hypothetical protein n=1 Tax=Janibacter anophelis TaxID=319054 RepID=UPI0009FFD7A0
MPLIRAAPTERPTVLLRCPRAVVDVVDETYVRAAPQVVREALDAPGLLEGLWPGLEREVVQDRGAKGVRWRCTGQVEGRMEIWLEPSGGGTIVHHFVHGTGPRAPQRWAREHRRRWKQGLNEIKDRLEGRSR